MKKIFTCLLATMLLIGGCNKNNNSSSEYQEPDMRRT